MGEPFLRLSARQLIKKIRHQVTDSSQYFELYHLLLDQIPDYFFTEAESITPKEFKSQHDTLRNLLEKRKQNPASEELIQEQLKVWLYFQGEPNPYRKNDILMDYDRDIERRKHEFISCVSEFYRRIAFPDPDATTLFRIVYFYIRMLAWSGAVYEGNFELETLGLYYTKQVKNNLRIFLEREKEWIK